MHREERRHLADAVDDNLSDFNHKVKAMNKKQILKHWAKGQNAFYNLNKKEVEQFIKQQEEKLRYPKHSHGALEFIRFTIKRAEQRLKVM